MIRKIARPALASVYIADGADTIINTDAHVDGTKAVLRQIRTVLPRKYAKQLPQDAELVTRALGGVKVGAGSMLALGKAPRLSAGTLAVLAVPTILARHAFWETQVKEEKIARRQGFLTSIALLGGLAITSLDTEGKPGLKWRANHAAKRANKQIQQALPTKSETEKFVDSAQENASVLAASAKGWFGDASEKVSEYAAKAQDYVEDNKDDWLDFAGTQAEQAKKGFAKAADRASGFFEDAQNDASSWLQQAQKDSKVARKKVVKQASIAQQRAVDALAQAEKSTGAAAKKASKQANKLQKQADKKLAQAQKRVKKAF
ncbi:DoxX family protein [Corynebacterium sp. 35RC1]|nr:DoxX family protein [Corynebacterium sp. 35RC1]